MIWRILVFALAATSLLQGDASAGTVQAAPPYYKLEATLDYAAATLKTHEEVTYSNRTGVALTEIVFNVTPAHFDAFTLEGCYEEGRAADCPLRGVSLHVPLAQVLPPGGQRRISLDFTVTVPWQQGRFGRNADLIALGNWYPVVNIYRGPRLSGEGRPAGWAEHDYSDAGDAFFTEVADYEVVITAQQPVVLAHTGRAVRREGNTTYIVAEQVRDFALAVSDRFRAQATISEGVRIAVYYLSGHEDAAEQYLKTAEAVLAWASQMVAPYPWPQLTLAEMPYPGPGTAGQEYPQLILLASNLADHPQGRASTPEVLVTHEVLHQWFYAWVGNDQIYEPWLDEALVTWLTMHYVRVNFPQQFDRIWLDWVENSRRGAEQRVGKLNVGLTLPEASDGAVYYASVYHQGAVFLEQIYQLLGEEAFFGLLREYTALYGNRIATASALLDLAQSKTSQNLWPLYYENLRYSRYSYPAPPQLDVVWPPYPDTPLVVSLTGTDTPSAVAAILDETPVPVRVTDRRIEILVEGRRPELVEGGRSEPQILTLTLFLPDGRRLERATVLPAQEGPYLTPTAIATAMTEKALAPSPAPDALAPPRPWGAEGGSWWERYRGEALGALAVAALIASALGLGVAMTLWRRGGGDNSAGQRPG